MGLFRSKKNNPETIAAHILDTDGSYVTETWSIGGDVNPDVVARYAESGNLYVVSYYKASKVHRAFCNRACWLHVKAESDWIQTEWPAAAAWLSDKIERVN